MLEELINELTHIAKQNEELAELLDEYLKKEGCECTKEAHEEIKDFEECSLGEQYILYLLEKGCISPLNKDKIIEDAEQCLIGNKVVQFIFMKFPEMRPIFSEILNSLYDVDISKLRCAKKD